MNNQELGNLAAEELETVQKNKYIPQKTWFFKRGDGEIFATGEKEAWEILRNRGNWMRRDFKLIGASDGKTFGRVLADSANLKKGLQEKVAELKKILKRYRDAEEKFKFEDLLEDDDPKVITVRKRIDETDTELLKNEGELKEIARTIFNKAFQAELESSTGKMELPTNQDIETPGGRSSEIKSIMAK